MDRKTGLHDRSQPVTRQRCSDAAQTRHNERSEMSGHEADLLRKMGIVVPRDR
jgi:hypothetical protein